MNLVQAREIAVQLEELIYITLHNISGLRRENCINALARALADAFPEKK